MELLEGVNQGWGRGDVAGFLLAKPIKDGDLVAWLRRFGDRLLAGAHGGTALRGCGGIASGIGAQVGVVGYSCGRGIGRVGGECW